MDADKLIDRIRKLLAVAADTPYEAEAETAMQLAQKLMLEHGLSQEQIEATDTDRKWAREKIWAGKRRSSADDYALVIVQEFFFVRALVTCQRLKGNRSSRPRSIDFLGLPEHVAIAKYVYVFLCRTFQRLWDLRVEVRHRRRSWDWLPKENPGDYFIGLYIGFSGKLRAQRKAAESGGAGENALIVVSNALTRLEADLDREVDRISGGRACDIARPSKASRETVAAGIGDGAQINMRTPLSAPANQTSLIS